MSSKEIKIKPGINGTIECKRGDRWDVVDLNPERVNVQCPVCGDYVSIRTGLEPK